MEAAGLLHAAVQMSLRSRTPRNAALGTLPLLLDVFSRRPISAWTTGPTRSACKGIPEDQATRRRPRTLGNRGQRAAAILSREHAGTWTAQADLAEALRERRASLIVRGMRSNSAIRAWETSAKATTESAMRTKVEAMLHSVAASSHRTRTMTRGRCSISSARFAPTRA